jgi:hypothetical protein
MRSVRIVFYKAPFQSITDLAISLWTGIFNPLTPPYSHCEIGFEVEPDVWRYFSSSIRDGGTRFKWGDDILKNLERWDIYEKEYDDNTVQRMLERAVCILDKKYDVLGILGFLTVTGQVLNNKDRWYCSEATFFVLTGLWNKRISPRCLSKRISGSKMWNKLNNKQKEMA